jgi:thiamine biosynthesis lipoprotein
MTERQANVRAAQLWLGTLVQISLEDSGGVRPDAAFVAAFAEIARVHRSMSLHDSHSELSCINREAVTSVQPVSTILRDVLTCALDVAARSAGAFDPTVGARVAALGFLPPQTHADVNASWRDIELTPRGVRFARALTLDFSGIAKGYAVDRAIEALRAAGVDSGCVNAGGDIRSFGTHREIVHVRIDGPRGFVAPLVELNDAAVATSAYGAQRRRIGGRWATPLIDPRDGSPSLNPGTVSVVAPTCMIADALTKVVALRGAGASAALEEFGASATVLSPVASGWECTRLPQDRLARTQTLTTDIGVPA